MSCTSRQEDSFHDNWFHYLKRVHMTDYDLIIKQMSALAEELPDQVPVMANLSSILFYSMEDVSWAGFYTVRGDELVLGPFQGKVACVRIKNGKGVCGTAWAEDRTQLVPDVHAFPGHIACDSSSNSEIVIPVYKSGELFGVLDIDSPEFCRFSKADEEGLNEFVKVLEGALNAF